MRRVHFIYVYNDGTCQLRVGIKLAECTEAERSWPGLARVVTLLWHSTTACRFIDDVAYMGFQYSKAGKLMRIGRLPCISATSGVTIDGTHSSIYDADSRQHRAQSTLHFFSPVSLSLPNFAAPKSRQHPSRFRNSGGIPLTAEGLQGFFRKTRFVMENYSDAPLVRYFISLVTGISNYASGSDVELLKVCD